MIRTDQHTPEGYSTADHHLSSTSPSGPSTSRLYAKHSPGSTLTRGHGGVILLSEKVDSFAAKLVCAAENRASSKISGLRSLSPKEQKLHAGSKRAGESGNGRPCFGWLVGHLRKTAAATVESRIHPSAPPQVLAVIGCRYAASAARSPRTGDGKFEEDQDTEQWFSCSGLFSLGVLGR